MSRRDAEKQSYSLNFISVFSVPLWQIISEATETQRHRDLRAEPLRAF
ncbi:MAG: hypothetical protein OIN66_17865 [Candidatus Methanoperedens sp.]|nr:hypothetical protein [Candidatus Methanoperedens sp.]